MPIMKVTYQERSLSDVQKSALAKRLTDLMIQMEGGADTVGGRSFAWVIYDEIKEGDWWAGGRADSEYVASPGKFLVDVRIPEGYMNTTHKQEVTSGVTAALMDTLGATDETNAGNSMQVIIHDVTEGNWAAGGKTISLANIAGTVGLSKAGQRFAWVRSYFAAKARQFSAAGYPSDTGGLLPPNV
jgi:phenylpyruvate tautomerase PptA (4-oxalocrotonate tautomerase family)